MMRTLLVVLGVLTALVVLATAVGWMRPAGHVASSRVDLEARRDDVWAALVDFAGWPAWNTGVDAMESAPDRDGRPVWVLRGPWGEMPSIVEELDPPSRLVTRIPDDAGIGFTGSWTYELAERPDGGSRVTITERGEVESPWQRLMMIFGDAHATQRQFLRDLGARMGETVEPEAAD